MQVSEVADPESVRRAILERARERWDVGVGGDRARQGSAEWGAFLERVTWATDAHGVRRGRFEAPIWMEPFWSAPSHVRAKRRDESEAWGAMLGRVPWDWFITMTFDRPVGYEAGARAVRRWLRKVPASSSSGLAWVLAAEKPTGHAWPHWHGLIVGVASTWVWAHWQRWQRREGRARIELVDSSRAVSLYCTKGSYLTKDAGCEVELGGRLEDWLQRPAADVPAVPAALLAPRGRGGKVTRQGLEALPDDRLVWVEQVGGGWTLGRGDEAGEVVARVHRNPSGLLWVEWGASSGYPTPGAMGPFTSMDEARVTTVRALVESGYAAPLKRPRTRPDCGQEALDLSLDPHI